MADRTDPADRPDTPPPPAELVPEVRVDASNLRGLAHPLRLRVLGLLRRNGPATATQLAAQVGESSGSLSYHLRQLEAYGFVTDDDRPASGRERWWRAVHRATRFDDPTPDATPEQKLVGAEFLGLVTRVYADRLLRFGDHLETLEADLGPAYAQVATVSDWNLRLRPERATELARQLEALVESYRDAPDDGDDIVPLSAMVVLMPGKDA